MIWAYKENKNDPHLEVVGIFSTEEKAISNCLTENNFYGEFNLDEANHISGEPWPTISPYPKQKEVCIDSI